MTAKKRGTCRVCNRSVALLADGRIGLHSIAQTFPPQHCSGWGQHPQMTPVSASKARLTADAKSMKDERDELTFKLVRLLAYVINMQDDHPELAWPDLPDSYSEMVWRYAA